MSSTDWLNRNESQRYVCQHIAGNFRVKMKPSEILRKTQKSKSYIRLVYKAVEKSTFTAKEKEQFTIWYQYLKNKMQFFILIFFFRSICKNGHKNGNTVNKEYSFLLFWLKNDIIFYYCVCTFMFHVSFYEYLFIIYRLNSNSTFLC